MKAAELVFTSNNTVSEVRADTFQGRGFLVAPVVAQVAGVVNGELVPAEELSEGVESWNGRPLTVGHPKRNGGYTSANEPQLLEEYAVGSLFGAQFADGKIKGEAWVDLALAAAHPEGPALIAKLLEGAPVEVSTAYFRSFTDQAGEWNGKAYETVAYDLKPDHLALLLHDTGACSWADGCGVPRANREGSMKFNIRDAARTPAYEGTEETSWADVGKSFGDYLKGYYAHTDADAPDEMPTSVVGAPTEARAWIASNTLLGNAGAEEAQDLLFFPVVNPSTNNLNAGALRAVLGGRGSAAGIPEDAKESAQAKARSLLEKEFGDEEEEVSAQVATASEAVLRKRDAWWKDLLAGLFGERFSTRRGRISNAESLDEQARKVRDAWYTEVEVPASTPADEAMERSWVREVFDDRVIVESGDKLLAVPYQTTEDGITFSDPVEVEVQYVEVEPAASETPATEGEVTNMAKHAEVVANRFGFAVEDLADVPESVLAALADHEEPGPCQEFTALIEYVGEHGGPEATLEELQEVAANRQQEVDELVTNLVANEACAFSEEELRGFSLDVLQGLDRMARPGDYSGVPGQSEPRATQDQEYELPAMD